MSNLDSGASFYQESGKKTFIHHNNMNLALHTPFWWLGLRLYTSSAYCWVQESALDPNWKSWSIHPMIYVKATHCVYHGGRLCGYSGSVLQHRQAGSADHNSYLAGFEPCTFCLTVINVQNCWVFSYTTDVHFLQYVRSYLTYTYTYLEHFCEEAVDVVSGQWGVMIYSVLFDPLFNVGQNSTSQSEHPPVRSRKMLHQPWKRVVQLQRT